MINNHLQKEEEEKDKNACVYFGIFTGAWSMIVLAFFGWVCGFIQLNIASKSERPKFYDCAKIHTYAGDEKFALKCEEVMDITITRGKTNLTVCTPGIDCR